MALVTNKLSTLFRLLRTSLTLSRSVSERQCSLTAFCQEHAHLLRDQQFDTSLDLGCGNNPQNPFQLPNLLGIDLSSDNVNVINADISTDPIPFPNQTIGVITAFHFIEHIPRVSYRENCRFPFINLMNEIYRTLKVGGLFLSVTPAFPFQACFSDPTHVNSITEKTFKYYFASTRPNSSPMASIYGFNGNFTCVGQAWDSEILISLLRKV